MVLRVQRYEKVFAVYEWGRFFFEIIAICG